MEVSAAEARVRMLAQRVEDSGFKYARPPTAPLGGPRRPPERPARREPDDLREERGEAKRGPPHAAVEHAYSAARGR